MVHPTRPALPAEGCVDDDHDALGDFLRNHAAVHERMGEPVPPALLLNGAIGGGLVALAALVFLVLPDPASMRDSGFIFFGDHLAASLTQLGKGLAAALLALGLLMLAADGTLALAKPRMPVEAHYACAAQLVVGTGTIAPAVVVAMILISSLLIWIALICAALIALGLIVSIAGSS